jgi:homoserine kinase type II
VAILTPVSLDDADRVTQAHGLGACHGVTGVEAGSVNSNFFVETDLGRHFLRLYEEQEEEGVAYEWALLEHLGGRGLGVPRRLPGPAPGVCRVASKCTALFELAPGEERCAAMWRPGHVEQVGDFLGRCHRAGDDFGWRRSSRFGSSGVAQRLAQIAQLDRPELEAARSRLERTLAPEGQFAGLPRGVVHGDFFRDNLRFAGDALVCVLDWESAADGPLLLDLAVAILALTYGDDFAWDDARALMDAYRAQRPLTRAEWLAFRAVAMQACVRFATTRIQDFHLRALAMKTKPKREFRRFLERLDALEALSDQEFAELLGR